MWKVEVLCMSREGPPWRWCWRREGRGRRPKPRFIRFQTTQVVFAPLDESGRPVEGEPIYMNPDELEALRLVYYLGLTQEEAAEKMGVSRGTLWRALSSGRKKLISALIERRPLILMSGPPL